MNQLQFLPPQTLSFEFDASSSCGKCLLTITGPRRKPIPMTKVPVMNKLLPPTCKVHFVYCSFNDQFWAMNLQAQLCRRSFPSKLQPSIQWTVISGIQKPTVQWMTVSEAWNKWRRRRNTLSYWTSAAWGLNSLWISWRWMQTIQSQPGWKSHLKIR